MTRLTAGSTLCGACELEFAEFDCRSCGGHVRYARDYVARFPEVAEGICSTCNLRKRMHGISESDMQAIRATGKQGFIAMMKEIRARLGWSFADARDLADILSNEKNSDKSG